MAKKKPELKVLKKGRRCGKGWARAELKIGKKVYHACIRIAKPKGVKPKGMTWVDWAMLPINIFGSYSP